MATEPSAESNNTAAAQAAAAADTGPSTSSRSSPNTSAGSSRPHGLPQIRPQLSVVVDSSATICDSSSNDLPTSTQFGPPTCSMYGPSTCTNSTGPAQQPKKTLSTTGSIKAAPFGNCRKSVRHHVMFSTRRSSEGQTNTSSTSTSNSSRSGAGTGPNPAAASTTGRKSNRLSTAASACIAADRLLQSVPDSPGSASTVTTGISGTPRTARSNSNSPRAARASSVVAAKHYGAWFLPAQDWGYVSHLNPGSTWSRKAMHFERPDEHQEVVQHLGLAVGEEAVAAAATAAAAEQAAIAAAAAATACASDVTFASEPGAAARQPRTSAVAAAAAVAAAKSDPGSATWGVSSPRAYKRAAARSIYGRASLAVTTAAACAAAAAGPGLLSSPLSSARLGNEIVTDSEPGAWEHQPLTARLTCVSTTPLGVPGSPWSERSAVSQVGDGIFAQVPSGGSMRLSSSLLPTVFERLSSPRSSSSSGARISTAFDPAGPPPHSSQSYQPFRSSLSSPGLLQTPGTVSTSGSGSTTQGCLNSPSSLGLSLPMPAGAKALSKLGPGHGADSTAAGVGQTWLGHGPVTEADEVEEAAAAIAEQQYYEQLAAIAGQQAKLHGQLRDTYVLKAYKDFLQSKGFRQPVSIRRLPKPTEHAIEQRKQHEKLQQMREHEYQLQRQQWSANHKAQQQVQQQAQAQPLAGLTQHDGSNQPMQTTQQQQQQQHLSLAATAVQAAVVAGCSAEAEGALHSSAAPVSSRSPRASLASPSRLRASSRSPGRSRSSCSSAAASPRVSLGDSLRCSNGQAQQQQQQQQALPLWDLLEQQQKQQQLADLEELRGSCHPHAGLGSEDWHLLEALLTHRQTPAAAAAAAAATTLGGKGFASMPGCCLTAREAQAGLSQRLCKSVCGGALGVGGKAFGCDSSTTCSGSSSGGMRLCQTSRESRSCVGSPQWAQSSADCHGLQLNSSRDCWSVPGSRCCCNSDRGSLTPTAAAASFGHASSVGASLKQAAAAVCSSGSSQGAVSGAAAGSHGCGSPSVLLSLVPLPAAAAAANAGEPSHPGTVQLQAQVGILQTEGSFDWDAIDLIDPTTPRTPATVMTAAAAAGFAGRGGGGGAVSGSGSMGALLAGGGGLQLDPEVASILPPEDAALCQQLLPSRAGQAAAAAAAADLCMLSQSLVSSSWRGSPRYTPPPAASSPHGNNHSCSGGIDGSVSGCGSMRKPGTASSWQSSPGSCAGMVGSSCSMSRAGQGRSPLPGSCAGMASNTCGPSRAGHLPQPVSCTGMISSTGGTSRIGQSPRPQLQCLDMSLLEPVVLDIIYTLPSTGRKHGGTSSRAGGMPGQHSSCGSRSPFCSKSGSSRSPVGSKGSCSGSWGSLRGGGSRGGVVASGLGAEHGTVPCRRLHKPSGCL